MQCYMYLPWLAASCNCQGIGTVPGARARAAAAAQHIYRLQACMHYAAHPQRTHTYCNANQPEVADAWRARFNMPTPTML